MSQRNIIAWVVVLVWAAVYVRKVVDPAFPVPAEVTPVMLLVGGYLFGKDIKDRLTGGRKDKDDDDDAT